MCETVTAVGVGIGEAGRAGARRVGRAGGLRVGGTAEENLRIGALEDAGDASSHVWTPVRRSLAAFRAEWYASIRYAT